MNLYEISQKYLSVLSGDPETGEINEDDLNQINDTLEAKAENYAKYISNVKADISGIDAEIKRLSDRKKSMQNKVDYLKKNLQDTMTATGKTKFKTDLFSFSVVRNGGKDPINFTGDVPRKYCKVEYTPDKELIRSALESGKKLKFAEIGERGEHLNIR